MHLYDADLGNGLSFLESDTKESGTKIITAETDFAKIGLSICYDLRFPEMFRIQALNGADIITVPACFTLHTGKDHWEVLLRARAIENHVYIIAPNQIGMKATFESYGKSVIIDPWGNVVALASDKECVIVSEIDFDYLNETREKVPSLKNRNTNAYLLK